MNIISKIIGDLNMKKFSKKEEIRDNYKMIEEEKLKKQLLEKYKQDQIDYEKFVKENPDFFAKNKGLLDAIKKSKKNK